MVYYTVKLAVPLYEGVDVSIGSVLIASRCRFDAVGECDDDMVC